jgi:predicted nuclease of predicted toxin-antitoxin system
LRIKLDENLGAHRAVERLRSAGHDVATVPDQRLQAASDVRLAEVCRAEDRCLLTLDLGFSDSVRFVPSRFGGIVVLRLPSKRTPTDLYAALDTFVTAVEGRDVRGKLWIVQGRRIREHQEE